MIPSIVLLGNLLVDDVVLRMARRAWGFSRVRTRIRVRRFFASSAAASASSFSSVAPKVESSTTRSGWYGSEVEQ